MPTTARARAALAPAPVPLLALRVICELPNAVGVPEISPVLPLTLSPAGRPLALKLVGPLVAAIWYVNGWPSAAPAAAALLIAGRPTAITKLTLWLAELVAFCTVTLALLVPAVVGVPVIRPVALTLRLAGNPVAPKPLGLLLPVIWYAVMATPTSPLALLGLVTAGAPSVMPMLRLWVPVPAPLLALSVRLYVPTELASAGGVPEITPLVRVRKGGRLLAPKLVGLLSALIG